MTTKLQAGDANRDDGGAAEAGLGPDEAPVFPPELADGGLLLCLLLGGVFFLLHEAECLPDTVRGACAASFIVAGVLLVAGVRAVAQRRRGGPAGRTLAKVRWIEAWAFHWRRHPLCLGGNLVLLGGCLALRWYAPILIAAVVQGVFYYGVAAGVEAVRGRR